MKNVGLARNGGLKFITVALLGAAMFVTGCSSAPKLPQSERSVQYIIETPKTKRITNFHRAKSWLEKSFSGLNTVIQYEDMKNRRLVGKGSVRCNELKHFNDPNNYMLSYVVDIDMKTWGKTVVSFEQLEMKPDFYDGKKNFARTVHNIDSREDLAAVAVKCLTPVQADLVSSIKSSQRRSIASERF